MTDTLKQVGQLSPDELALLIQRLRAKKNAAGQKSLIPCLPRTAGENVFPPSFAQERMWFLDQLEGEYAVYSSVSALRMKGPLERDILEKSLNQVVQRHEILRTIFVEKDGLPVQCVAPQMFLPLKTLDLSALPEARREGEVRRLQMAEYKQPFDLAKGPMLRATLLRLSAQEHVFFIAAHHILVDGWSYIVLVRELLTFYDAFARGESPRLAALPIQYADYAAWQRESLQGDGMDTLLRYWKKRLNGDLPVLALPLDHPRPAVQTFHGAFYRHTLPLSLSDGLHALAQKEGGTLFMVLLAAFQALLYRYSGQTDILVGTPIAGRSHVELEALIGFFINTLVLRTDLSGNPTFREFLKRVRAVTLGAYAHQEMPFEKLVDALHLQRDRHHSPLFQVMFVLQNAPSANIQIFNLKMADADIDSDTAQFDLMVFFMETQEGLVQKINYNTDLFDPQTIERMSEHLQILLQAVIAHPDRRIAELPLMADAERRQLLVTWNQTQAEFPGEACLHELLEEQAERTPHALALVFDGQSLTYRQLNQRASQLAGYLRRLGVGVGDLVGIGVERSLEMVVGLLGVLKAGGAYVPLDPEYPRERLAYILENAAPRVLLTQSHLLERLPHDACQTVCLDADWEQIEQAGTQPLPFVVDSHNLAYVIYTSGSTGKPKGVGISHRAVVNFLTSIKKEPGLLPEDVLLAVTTLCFDIAAVDIFLPLLVGARIVIASREAVTDAAQLVELLSHAGITVMQATPATWRMLLAAGWQGTAGLKVFCGGEAMPSDLAGALLERCDELWNIYGPTETTIWSAIWHVTPGAGVIRIGKPVANTQCYVLDRQLNPQPGGVPGELYIAGEGLGRGYHQRPDLTAEKFLPNPFAGQSGRRMYRTGDLARWLPDGTIECLGRLDHQVKIRGFRIELGEIEATLRQHPGAREGVVVARRDPGGQGKLVGYVVPAWDRRPAELVDRYDAEQASTWQSVWEEAYRQPASAPDPTFDISGWNSSYTGRPIPAEEMREWVENTAARVLSLHPERALEIGCGTGLVLFRVAPACKQYIGTDFSAQVLETLQPTLKQRNLPQVALSNRMADDFTGIEPQSLDTVILNSVIQYFPGIDYLLRVLQGAVNVVADGGSIYLGDVRCLPLLEAFHASVQLAQLPPTASVEELRRRVQTSLAQEKELVVDPAFFFALKQHLPKIGHVEILPKRGVALNELTKFRCDVILHIGKSPSQESRLRWFDWDGQATLETIRQVLMEEHPAAAGFRCIPNARVLADVQLAEWLDGKEKGGVIGEWLGDLQVLQGVAIEDLQRLADEMGYTVHLSWRDTGKSFDAILQRHDALSKNGRAPLAFPEERAPIRPWHEYARNPLPSTATRDLLIELHEFLAAKLPEYMLPALIVVLDKMPLTPNGKIDRRALPEADRVRPGNAAEFVAPATQTEEKLARIWQHLLGIDLIGRDDNFFALGGHSLLATQLLSRLRQMFGVDLPLRMLFEITTLRALAEQVERQRQTQGGLKRPPIASVDRSQPLPLSFSQQRLWFLDRLDPGGTAYNMPAAVRLQGKLDVAALERSLNAIVQRHEILRTTFAERDEQPVQIIASTLHINLPVFALDNFSDAERDLRVAKMTQEEARQAFDLSIGPLVRWKLLRLGEAEHVLLITWHHIVADGWSLANFVRELSTFYDACVFEQSLSLPPRGFLPSLQIQYADYAAWQRNWLQGETLDSQLAYWKERLAGAPPVLDLPTDRPRPQMQSFRGAHLPVHFPLALTQALKSFSREEGATLFMTLLAAFQVLLSRYSGQTDILVGSPIANRNQVEIEGLIGLFINTLVLRTDVSAATNFRQLLQQVRETTLGAYAHQDLPFEMLVDALQPQRALSHSPLFQVMFILQNTPQETAQLSGLILEMLPVEQGMAKFDLTLSFTEVEQGLAGGLEYNTDLFDRETVERMVAHFQVLLEAAVAEPDRHLAVLPLLVESEREQLLGEWNQTQAEFSHQKCLHELFEEQVSKTPDARALLFGGQGMTYLALDEHANQLAHYLRRIGVRPGAWVGISVERSLEMVVGLLGILKAGGTYVPLDPQYPGERLAYMLEDAAPQVLLTQQHGLEKLPSGVAVPVCLDTDWPHIQHESTGRLSCAGDPKNLAYVIYTSGSTGRPKGVGVPHRAAVNFLESMKCDLSIRQADVFLAVTTLSFDIAGLELFLPLVAGAQVTIASREAAADGAQLLRLLANGGITAMQATPATWRMLLAAGWQGTAGLKVLCGGEALLRDLADALLVRCDELWNLYGPTETTIWSSAGRVTGGDGAVSIGKAIANTQLYVLDSRMNPQPVGVAGELYIGGEGLSRGYMGHPDLTAEKFVPNPFGGVPGERLYRTGDLCRYLPDGNIQHLGRLDHQVKLRGFRIELGEIEVALGACGGVRESAVVAREEAPGDKRLVAYVVAEGEPAPTSGALREKLKQRLPEYMLPSAYVFLERLPLTPSGKVDRKALPAPGQSDVSAGKAYVAPQSAVEKLLADIWAQVLGLEQVGLNDDFFALGGHSLLATQVVSRLRQILGVELPLRSLFELSRLGELAAEVENQQRAQVGLSLPPIVPVDRSQPLPLSFSQQRLWFLDKLDPGSAAYNVPAALRLRGPLDVDALRESLNVIVQRHATLRTTFSLLNEQPVQEIAPFVQIDIPMIDLQKSSGEQQEVRMRALAAAEARRPFDLSGGPLMRVTLLSLHPEEHILLVTFHHIISDGWSLGVLIRELIALYSAQLEKQDALLPELSRQYADFAAWQRQWLQGKQLDLELAYWKDHLAGVPPILDLPTDHPRPAELTFRGAHQTNTFPKPLLDAARALSRQEGVTLFMTLLAVFEVLLYRYTGQTDLVIGTPIANRNHTDVEGLIGFFVNTLALRGNLAGAPTFRQLLERVRETALGAYAHQDMPFEMLVDMLQPQRSLSHAPLFQVMFILQNAPLGAMSLPGLDLEVLDVDAGTTQFDLTLSFTEAEHGLIQVLEYSTDLFDVGTIRRMMGHFQALLACAVANPDQRIGDLALLTEAERQHLLVEWNNTHVSRPNEPGIHQIIEMQAERNPGAVAVMIGENRLTYGELNCRANRLARRLRAWGVGPDTLVGLCLNRSVDALIGILGILKAGGAYVPLDPAWPQARLAFVMQDTQMPVLLTQGRWVGSFPESSTRVFCLDSDWADLPGEDDSNLENIALPEHLAYVIYTSGSTGVPKGVLVARQQLLHSIGAHRSYYPEPLTGYLLVSPFAFDSSVTGIFWTLCAGGTLALPPDNFVEDITCLADLIDRYRLSHLVWVPSLYHLLLNEVDVAKLASLTCVIVAGETCTKALVERHYHLLPNANLYNEFGPTECSVWSSVYRCVADERHTQVPVGFPIENVRAYVLDERMQLVPAGVVGEVYLGGSGVTYGYLNQPELTAACYLPDPFGTQPGGRIYKTGDLARYLPDGNLDFMGRRDHQVKLHGFRIELEEIEAALAEYPQVREAVVVIPEKVERLVAYLVADGEPQIDPIRRFLQERLPAYMVPSVFVSLDAFPRTTTGKIDRRALPDPESASIREQYVAPQTPIEQQLADIWAAVLGLEHVGVYDNFFSLGGDSIISIQVASRARQSGIHLAPRQLFQYQTIAELAGVVGSAELVRAEQGLVTGPVPLTPIQHWFFEQNFTDADHFNQALLLKTTRPLKPDLLEMALGELLSHHDALRMRFQQNAAGWQQFDTGLGVVLPFQVVDLSHLPEALQQIEIEQHAARLQASLNLAGGPVMFVAYWALGAERPGRLLIVIHHLVVDGVSWRVLLEDLQRAYEQLAQAQEARLPAKTTSFKQWGERLATYAQSEAVLQELDTWLSQPWGDTAPLPLDFAQGENTVASEQVVVATLDAAETLALLQDVSRVYRTQINDALLAALAQAIRPWTGRRTLLVDLEGHGREEIMEDVDLSLTVGWFTSVFPLLLNVEEAQVPGETLIAVKEQLRRVPMNGIHYGILRYLAGGAAAGLTQLPQAEIAFNYLGQTDQILSGGMFEAGDENIGPSCSPHARRAYVLEVNGKIANGCLHLAWSYSEHLHGRSTIEEIAENYLAALREMIQSCQSAQASEVHTEDFPAARLNRNELDKLLNAIGSD